jgi:hypothetical protein
MKLILDWLKKNLAFILGGIFLFCMVACFVSGCRYHKFRHPCPEPSIVTHTVLIHDTVTHTITKDHYISHTDTIIYIDTIIQPVDTVAILRDFFALHVYNRQWEDSLLKVNLRDTVTQNRFLENDFTYRILRPQIINYTTVDQSIHYAKYLYLGFDLPMPEMKYAEINAILAFRKGYIGLGYAPLTKGGSLNLGFAVAKFR